ncbi:glycosyl hydrolase family 43 [Mucilaginibacter frigoritolerans]|uniref:Glycosyl hydrolase family 43 n=1 Tax=Mucilaginibacter frigoritolerans TaxID=652788 RepID=A0A562TK54_9SPHI|nr:family 43 glycosylhydrolase [Mucilaginibacter frigoritolerans]TWI93929.1 glycosyl hydrolase family 43 [Mucilaginibacter frigoritolerans]
MIFKRLIQKNWMSLSLILLCLQCILAIKTKAQVRIGNPILPGYFADPTIIKEKGVFYICATIDPWGDKELGVFTTKDFVKFDRQHINWPTKQVCTSPSSNTSMVWAPCVLKGKDNKFYMYVAVGSELWAGVSNTPLGPWRNLKADNTPLVKYTDFPLVHNIDPECFIDDDGQAYLYWGSGYNWVNGHCMAVKLKGDMVTFDGIPVDVTTTHYFEAPLMRKWHNKYYLMFSNGKATDATYCVGYAVGTSPLGPFIEEKNWKILETNADSTTIGPGHHTVFRENGQDYILYHRIFPQNKAYVLRQLCLDSLDFDNNGHILKVNTNRGVKFSK